MRSCAAAPRTRRFETRSPRCSSAAPTGILRSELLKQRSCAKSRCRTSVAKHRPQLTNAARPATFEVEAYNERGEMLPTAIAGAHPLTLYVDKRELLTQTSLRHSPEALAIGY